MGQKIANGIVLLVGLGIIYVGANFLLGPETAAAGYGVPVSAEGNFGAFLSVKGIRDIGTGLALLVPFALGQRRVTGWVLLALTVIPITDGLIVLSYGSVATAFGWHFSTATLMLIGVALILSGAPKVAARTNQPSVQTS